MRLKRSMSASATVKCRRSRRQALERAREIIVRVTSIEQSREVVARGLELELARLLLELLRSLGDDVLELLAHVGELPQREHADAQYREHQHSTSISIVL